VRDHANLVVEIRQPFACSVEFRTADGRRAVKDLSMKVGCVDAVEIDETDRADAGRGEIEGDRRSEAAGADDQNCGVPEFLLSFRTDLRKDDLPRVPIYGSSRDTTSCTFFPSTRPL
jgi:hypothetical protein